MQRKEKTAEEMKVLQETNTQKEQKIQQLEEQNKALSLNIEQLNKTSQTQKVFLSTEKVSKLSTFRMPEISVFTIKY